MRRRIAIIVLAALLLAAGCGRRNVPLPTDARESVSSVPEGSGAVQAGTPGTTEDPVLTDVPGHRANILDEKYTHMGLGCCVKSPDDYAYWAQLFIRK